MNIETTIDSVARVENAGGVYYFSFPYTSEIGTTTENLAVRVPIKGEQPSPADRQALLEAITVQGGIGRSLQREDGSVRLSPTD